MLSELQQLSGCPADGDELYATVDIAMGLFETSEAEEAFQVMSCVCKRWNSKEGYLVIKEHLHNASFKQLPLLMKCVSMSVGSVTSEKFIKGVLRDASEIIEHKYTQRNSISIVETTDEDSEEEEDDELKIPFNESISESFQKLVPSLIDLVTIASKRGISYEIALFSSFILHAAHGSLHHQDTETNLTPQNVFCMIKESFPDICDSSIFARILLSDVRISHTSKLTEGVDDGEELLPLDSEKVCYPGLTALLYYVKKPRIMSPAHHAVNMVPYLMSSLSSTALGVVKVGLQCCESTLALVSPYSVNLLVDSEAKLGEATTDCDDREKLLSNDTDAQLIGTRDFEMQFELAQRLSSVMVQCPVAEFREKSDSCLQRLFKNLQETSRFKMYTYFIRSCPYHCVVGLIYGRLKDEVAAEYAACQEVGNVIASHSSFLKKDLFLFTVDLISSSSCAVEIILSGMSFLLFVVLREKRTPLLSISSSQIKNLESVITKIRDRKHEDTGALQLNAILSFTSDRLLDALAS